MNDWFKEIGPGCELPEGDLQERLDPGFVVIPGAVGGGRLARLAKAYDLAGRR
jgi:hypothetical protein